MMELKTVEVEGKTYAEIKDGKPLYVDDGKDIPFDAVHATETIARLNGEAQGHREKAERLDKNLKKYEGLDAKKAREALETVANLKDRDLVDAGEVDKIKAEAIKAVEEKFAPVVEERDELRTTLNKEMIGGRFSRSKYIGEKIAIPPDMVEARFGSNFRIEEGRVIAYDQSGNKVFSKSRPGETADFDEALEILVEAYPYKDNILKGAQSSGSGSQGGDGGGSGGRGKMSRSEFDEISRTDPMRASKLMTEDNVTLTD